MTSTIEQEAPAAAKPRGMTPEHKAKMQKARADALAARKAAAAKKGEAVPPGPPAPEAPPSPVSDEKDALIIALKAQLAAATPVYPDLSTLPKYECSFEVHRPGAAVGVNEKITSPDDPRWAEMSAGVPAWASRSIHNGTFMVCELVYARSGEILSRKPPETALTVDHPIALSKMRAYLATGDHTRIAP